MNCVRTAVAILSGELRAAQYSRRGNGQVTPALLRMFLVYVFVLYFYLFMDEVGAGKDVSARDVLLSSIFSVHPFRCGMVFIVCENRGSYDGMLLTGIHYSWSSFDAVHGCIHFRRLLSADTTTAIHKNNK